MGNIDKIKKIRTIRTGSAFYKVEYVKDLKGEDAVPLLGRTWLDRGLIRINNTLPFVTQIKTLHHEASHAIFYEYGFSWNEKKVDLFSKAFYAFILNNSEFIRQILKYGGKV